MTQLTKSGTEEDPEVRKSERLCKIDSGKQHFGMLPIYGEEHVG